MTNRNPRNSIKRKAVSPKSAQRIVVAKETASTKKKISVTTGDNNAQVLAATVGGAVIGNLIVPGIGGALFGGVIGALLGNGSRNKGVK